MSNETQTIYQSNEPVQQDGFYAVIGSTSTGPLSLEKRELVIVHMTVGMIFPNSEGRAVCWRLIEVDEDPNA